MSRCQTQLQSVSEAKALPVAEVEFSTSCVLWMTLGESFGQKRILNDPDFSARQYHFIHFIETSSGECRACCVLASVTSAGFS